MNIKIERDQLIQGLTIVGKAISNKSSLSALQGVYLETFGEKVLLRGTDIDISVETLVDAEIISPGTMLVDFKIINEVIRKLPNNTVSIDNDGETPQVEITCQKSKFTIVTMNSDEYPKFPTLETSIVSFNITNNTLRELITSTIYAVAQDDSRPILKGILLEVKSKTLTLVGLDGYRMSVKSEYIDLDTDFSVVIDAKHLAEIAKLLPSAGEIKVEISKNHVLFGINQTQIICRLFEGQYVNYKQLINDNEKFSIDIIGEDLYQALERATLVSKATSNHVVLNFDYKKETVVISSSSNMGKSKEEISVSINGLTEDFQIAFNVKYLLDVFKNSTEEEFTLHLNSNVNPCIIRGKGNDQETFLVLPIRLAV